MRTVIHIGMFKTGTTALQKMLSLHADELRKRGILYPHVEPGTRAQHRLSVLLKPYVPLWGRPVDFDDIAMARGQLDLVKQEVAQHRPEVLLLSSEAMFRPIDDGPQDLLDELAAISESVEICVWVRDPVEQFAAGFRQRAKSHRGYRPIAGVSYRAALESWIAKVGQDKVTVRRYARDSLVNREIFDDYLGAIFSHDLGLPKINHHEQNTSLSPEAIQAVQAYFDAYPRANFAKAGRYKARLLNFLMAFDRAHPPPDMAPLKPDVAARIRAATADVHWLRETFGIVFPATDYVKDGLGPFEPIPVEVLDEVFDVSPDRLHHLTAQLRRSHPKVWRALVGNPTRSEQMMYPIHRLTRWLRL